MSKKNMLTNLIEDYVEIRCEIFYFRLSNRLTDIIDTKEFKDLQYKKKEIKEKIDKILSEMEDNNKK